VCRSVERLLLDGEPQHQALTWLEDEVSRQTIEHYLGLEQISFKSTQNALEKETYWAITIFIPVPNQPGRYKKIVAPWLTGDQRRTSLGWSGSGDNLVHTNLKMLPRPGLLKVSGMLYTWAG